jgi:hypothetical protein
MENDTVTNPVEEQEVATEQVIEQEPVQDEIEGDTSDDENQEPDLIEVDYDGNRYKVPKALEKAIMQERDYTQSKQSLAEERRSFEENLRVERETFQREAQVQEALIEDVTADRAIQGRLDYLRSVNTDTLTPEQAQQYWNEFNMLRASKEDVSGRIKSRKAELAAERERSDANTLRQAIAALEKPDENLGWSGKYDEPTRARLTKVAKTLGVTDQQIAAIRDPITIKALNLASIGLEVLNKQRTALKTVKPEAKPLPTVSGTRARGSVDPDKMSTEQWMKYERSRVAKSQRG